VFSREAGLRTGFPRKHCYQAPPDQNIRRWILITVPSFRNTGKKLIATSFGIVNDHATLAQAQEKMNGINGCQDIFVTANGFWIEQAVKV
jgi:hypothetical protein